jgi:hypothetical protein
VLHTHTHTHTHTQDTIAKVLRRKGAVLHGSDVRLARQQLRLLSSRQVRAQLDAESQTWGASSARKHIRLSRGGEEEEEMAAREAQRRTLELAKQFASGELSKAQYLQAKVEMMTVENAAHEQRNEGPLGPLSSWLREARAGKHTKSAQADGDDDFELGKPVSSRRQKLKVAIAAEAGMSGERMGGGGRLGGMSFWGRDREGGIMSRMGLGGGEVGGGRERQAGDVGGFLIEEEGGGGRVGGGGGVGHGCQMPPLTLGRESSIGRSGILSRISGAGGGVGAGTGQGGAMGTGGGAGVGARKREREGGGERERERESVHPSSGSAQTSGGSGGVGLGMAGGAGGAGGAGRAERERESGDATSGSGSGVSSRVTDGGGERGVTPVTTRGPAPVFGGV